MNCSYAGSSVPTKNNGSIVTFVISENDDPVFQRSNTRHDFYQRQLRKHSIELAQLTNSRGRSALLQAHIDAVKGAKGSCILRSLSWFDVGRCFLFDSLHNLYLGLFKRLLTLWLDRQYRSEAWSVFPKTNELCARLSHLRFPSTTTRHPRSLHKFSRYKGSEFRLVLLFGYSIFEGILKEEYYAHLLVLVLAAHYAESRKISQDMVDVVDMLCRSFLLDFPNLYTKRHNVQVVHSILHMGETVRNFGPLSTYSTFNFENQLGILTRSCKSTRRHAIEIMNNMMYLRDASFELMITEMPRCLRKLVSPWLGIQAKNSTSSVNFVRLLHPSKCTDPLLQSLFHGDIVFYSTAFIGKVRFTTSHQARNKVSDDSNIIFKTGTTENFGRIRRIFKVDDDQPVFHVGVMSTYEDFRCTTSSNVYQYSDIRTGSFKEDNNDLFISAEQVVEKCVFLERENGICTFFRFPTLQGSS